MYLIIVGAGAVTKQLIATAQEQGHKVAVIEKQTDRAREIMQEFDVQVFHADIAEGGVLEEADVDNADAIIATTRDDSVNLMAMILGKNHNVKNLITLLQEKEHCGVFENLGFQVLSDPERLIAQKLYSFVDSK
ncbi:potassium channel family protein [Pleurocapsa sp. FMAR1]|uniref:potassium channel family protein n=1 Tax=Pleurocapsa sp. FMAR1 TaxID=3040204 RepID=UPI0029C7878C|nr:NAD-binding protein [Pleurocapsa sp. FMAR1]